MTFATNSVVKGGFRNFSGTIMFDAEDPANSTVAVQIDAASVDTGVEQRDNHLRSDDFFNSEVHHDLSFNSSRIDVLGDDHWRVTGDLSLSGQTHPVTLDTHYYGTLEDATGVVRAGFVSEVDLLRSDWGMDWNDEQDTGVLVSDRVRLNLYISAIPAEPVEASPTTEMPES